MYKHSEKISSVKFLAFWHLGPRPTIHHCHHQIRNFSFVQGQNSTPGIESDGSNGDEDASPPPPPLPLAPDGAGDGDEVGESC